jgi:Uma2 family endonuclease
MSTIAISPPPAESLADVLERLGNIPPSRIRMRPPPGAATEQDVLDVEARTGRPCELIDGVLVEKTTGYKESLLAAVIVAYLRSAVKAKKLGIVLTADGTLRILPGQVRVPDACFIHRDRFPGGSLPSEPIPAVAPDLAVEVLSEGNSEGEMRRKLADYFAAGVRLVWYVDPRNRTVSVFRAVDECEILNEGNVLTGGDVVPGFELPLAELFAEMEL